jgi:ribosomal protein S18 acetylase RimI-like enzyme
MKDNLRAIALYERLGFRAEGARRRAYIINGRPVDDLLIPLSMRPNRSVNADNPRARFRLCSGSPITFVR